MRHRIILFNVTQLLTFCGVIHSVPEKINTFTYLTEFGNSNLFELYMIFHHGTTMAAEIEEFTNSIPELRWTICSVIYWRFWTTKWNFFAIFIWGEKKCKHVKENYPCLNNNLALEITKLYGHNTEGDDDTASNYVKKRVEFHGNSSFRKESDIWVWQM